MPCRPLKLIIYHSPLFSAHWSLFIPSIQDSNIGKRIHVVGDSLNGFTHEFVRNENLEDETRSYSLIDIGEVDAEIVADAAADTGRDSEIRDAAAVDELERLALEVPAPMKTLRAAADVSTRTRVAVKNCQSWIVEYVELLVARHILGEQNLIIVSEAPKN